LNDFSEILENVPDYKTYMTVDELNSSSKELSHNNGDVVELLHLGASAHGESIDCLKVGDGKLRALLYGYPNSEEPFGGLLLEYLSQALTRNRTLLKKLDFTWYLVKCIDPDGARLNEGFVKGPLTPINFAKNYYRAPPRLAGEKNFPYRYGDLDFNNPLPETRVLMKVIDAGRIDLISSLHNMKFEGITCQVSEPCPKLYAPFQELFRKYGVFPRKRLGNMLVPGIQLAEHFTPVQNYVKARNAHKGPIQEITGTAIYEYTVLSNPNVFMMTPECCLWYDDRCRDDRLSDTKMIDVVKNTRQVNSENSQYLLSLYEKSKSVLKTTSPITEMIHLIMKEIRSPTVNVLDPETQFSEKQLNRPATIAEKIATEGRSEIYRMYNHELLKSPGNSVLDSCRVDAEKRLEQYNSIVQEKYDVKAFQIRDLIGVCLGSLLYSAEYVRWKTSFH
jgi:hypothetical protein